MMNKRTVSGTKPNMLRLLVWAIAVCAVAACLIAAVNRVLASAGTMDGTATGFPVYINELVSANSIYPDANGNTYDWIELYNTSDIAIDLSGYKLTDNVQKVRYTVPSGVLIPPKGYYVVWCNKGAGEGYADFSISRAGSETILLMNSRNVIVDRMTTLPLQSNAAMVRQSDGSWRICDFATPGYENSDAGYKAYLADRRGSRGDVRISEIMTSNTSYCGPDGTCTDWVELYNSGDAPAELSGMFLSDRMDAKGYAFPAGTVLAPGEYRVIYCDGDTTDPAYAPFSLRSGGGETVTLSDMSGLLLDEALTLRLGSDESQILSDGGAWTVTDMPTPGYPNTSDGRAAYLAEIAARTGDIRITEVMPANRSVLMDAFGVFSDWIELTNYDETEIDLAGYTLSDDPGKPQKWRFPTVALAPGARIVVFASGMDCEEAGELHASFRLSRQGGTISLYNPAGQVVGLLTYGTLNPDWSAAADEETGDVSATRYPTPGEPNTESGYANHASAALHDGELLINEVMPGNATLLAQSHGVYYDWIELKNVSGGALSLAGYAVTDDLEVGRRCPLPADLLDDGELLVLFCTGDETEALPKTNAALSLSPLDDRVYLLDPDGGVVDALNIRSVPYQKSCGRLPGKRGVVYFDTPTPGTDNGTGYALISDLPVASVAPGVYRDSTEMTVSLSAPGEIYYTLDGSTPNAQSARYSSPLRIAGVTIVRAVSIEEGKLASPAATFSYFLASEHTLPIVSVVTDKANLYDESFGIYAQRNMFDRTVERPANITYFGENGSFSTDCGLKLHGAGTRKRTFKRSLKITFRPRYGQGPLEFPLFEDNPTETFYSILLRNGQDYNRAFVRDEIFGWLAYRNAPALLAQDCRYCVLYVNGGYEGLYVIKEAFSSGYFAEHFNVSKESVELQRGFIYAPTEMKALMDFAKRNDLSREENFRYIEERVNLESLIDWCIFQGYSANSDISVNVRYYRSSEYDNNRWHYALFDTDFALDGPATFDYLFATAWHCVIPLALLKNETFRDMFLKRMAFHLNNSLTAESVRARYEALVAEIADEIPREHARYPDVDYGSWERYLQKLEHIMDADRARQLKRSIASYMHVPLSTVESYFTEYAA